MGRIGQGRDAEFQKGELRFGEGRDTGRKILEGAGVVGTSGSEVQCYTECNSKIPLDFMKKENFEDMNSLTVKYWVKVMI